MWFNLLCDRRLTLNNAPGGAVVVANDFDEVKSIGIAGKVERIFKVGAFVIGYLLSGAVVYVYGVQASLFHGNLHFSFCWIGKYGGLNGLLNKIDGLVFVNYILKIVKLLSRNAAVH